MDYLLNMVDRSEERPKGRNKQWNNMTDEQKQRFYDHRREKRQNWTEEQKEKAREQGRLRWANMSDETRRMISEQKQQRRRNMTPEQREELKERRRLYRMNMSEEQREKERERSRKKKKNMNEIQKQNARITHQKWVKSLPEEMRQKRRIKRQEYRAQMTQEQKDRDNERSRQKRLLMSEEEKAKLKERQRLRKASLTQEEKDLQSILLRQYRANLSEEARERTRQRLREYYYKKRQQKNGQKQLMDEEQKVVLIEQDVAIDYEPPELERDESDPLMTFIDVLAKINHTQNISDVIQDVDRQLFREFLLTFNIDYAHEFFIKFIIELIKMRHQTDSSVSPCELQDYVSDCLNYLIENHTELVYTTTSSLRQLKSSFSAYDYTLNPIHGHLCNWPYISQRINLPGFAMIRGNKTKDKFYLAKTFHKKSRRRDTSLNSERSQNPIVVSSASILLFLQAFYNYITNCEFLLEYKLKLTEIIKEAMDDVTMCGNTMEAYTKYSANLSHYPYVRSIAENRIQSDAVHLFQYSRPIVCFQLENVEAVIFKTQFYEPLVLTNVITCRCELCDENLGSILSNNLIQHLAEFHGNENNWKCVKCERIFTAEQLSRQRWKHDCL